MNLYLVKRKCRAGYDQFDSMVVSAESDSDARTLHPCEFVTHVSNEKWMGTYAGGNKIGQEYAAGDHSWIAYKDRFNLYVELIGSSDKPRGVILASFNAG